ncbi:hypothetical protein [Yersinia pekkanenii]|uniref:Lipoprotein n=1 Tax=Yersinia pekkanenii TaxID=1288385 RepID=A0A0T9RGE4_9GAMM|nr:hypothetical protein [Yersinia pekkanenii]CNI59788.1 putative lipoprotein [Yersinia pekkanenii]CRY69473.1 putative lipoprotein [Yersinia pekkanenii]
MTICKYIIIPILLMSGCVMPIKKLSSLSNDDLCITLGEKNNNGPMVLKITKEIEDRGGVINKERCYILSMDAIGKRKSYDKKDKERERMLNVNIDQHIRDAAIIKKYGEIIKEHNESLGL